MVTSRIARKPVIIPSGVEVKCQDQEVAIKGPKGTVKILLHPYVVVNVDKSETKVTAESTDKLHLTGAAPKLHRSAAGCTRAKIANGVEGVTKGYERKLVLVGVGYRAQGKGKVLNLSIGYSHPVNIDMPEGITVETPSQTEITLKGIDKSLLGQIAAKIRAVRPPEPYKGKGIRYFEEVVNIKETKKK